MSSEEQRVRPVNPKWFADRMQYLQKAADELTLHLGVAGLLTRKKDGIYAGETVRVSPEPVVQGSKNQQKFEDTTFIVVLKGEMIGRFGYGTPALESAILQAVRLARRASSVK